MSKTQPLNLVRLAVMLAAAATLAGCAASGEMTPQQREGVELRRFCEQHPEEVERCLGFLGWR
jgi:ABC-type uncharacterized transport system auxiliary subunit